MIGKGKNSFKQNVKGIIHDFDNLPLDETIKKPRVGIVGEILVKFSPSANNYLVDLLESEGAEAVFWTSFSTHSTTRILSMRSLANPRRDRFSAMPVSLSLKPSARPPAMN